MKCYAILLIMLLPACSTIVEGRSQQIMVNTNPAGADCDFTRNGEKIGSVSNTPSSVYIEKTKDDITITCHKKGYEKAIYLNHSNVAGATVGNIVFGGAGVIGWGIDSAIGSDNKYDSPVSITLNKK